MNPFFRRLVRTTLFLGLPLATLVYALFEPSFWGCLQERCTLDAWTSLLSASVLWALVFLVFFIPVWYGVWWLAGKLGNSAS